MTFEIALSGINAASTELSTISNNIANNATTGFKRSRAEFADVYAQNTFTSNRTTVGQGVRVANIRQDHSQGDTQFTDRNLDLAVEGNGLFRLDDNGTALYTRSGNFGLDKEGYIVNTRGDKLTGYGVDSSNEILPVVTELQIDYSDLKAKPSTQIALSANLDSTAEVPATAAFSPTDSTSYNHSTSTLVYDSLGATEVVNLYFQKSAENSWNAFPMVGEGYLNAGGQLDGVEINFKTDGTLDNVNGTGGTSFTSEPYVSTGGAADLILDFDLADMTQFGDAFGVNRIAQNGSSAGRLEDFDIDTAGIIFGRYSNGESKSMGQVTLSNFANELGLRQVGSTNWTETSSSGEPATGTPGSASLGKLQSGGLEGSNVDLTQELVSMITAQRSFQANAKVISTGDTLTQTVINIGR